MELRSVGFNELDNAGASTGVCCCASQSKKSGFLPASISSKLPCGPTVPFVQVRTEHVPSTRSENASITDIF